MGIPLSVEPSASFVDEINDKELMELSSRLIGESLPTTDQLACIQVLISFLFCDPLKLCWLPRKWDIIVYDVQALRDHWRSSPSSSIQLQELGPLLRDYQRLIIRRFVYGFIPPFPLCIIIYTF